MVYSKDLTRKSEGTIEVAEFPNLKFSTIDIADETFPVGDPVFNPTTEVKEKLPGEAELGTLTLSTPESPFMRAEAEKLVQSAKANPRKVFTFAHRKSGQTRIYQGRLSGSKLDTGTDKDATTTTVEKLTLTFELTKRESLT
jgi:hypothetical protein